jgi:hypothetical protein
MFLPKRQIFSQLCCVISSKILVFVTCLVRISDPAPNNYFICAYFFLPVLFTYFSFALVYLLSSVSEHNAVKADKE